MISYKPFDDIIGGAGMAKSEGKMCQILVRLPKKERLLAEKLAKYLYEYKLIERPSINETARYSLMFLAYAIARQTENDTPRGDTGEE